MRRIPPLAAVRVFEAAARHLNFTTAAAELGMTQAAVSYQIKLLEERLGIALFIRQGKKVVLTEEAGAAAPLVAQAFDTLDSAFALVRQEGETVLRLTAPTTFATKWLAPRLGIFQLAHPDIAIRLHTSNRIENLGAGGFEMAIRIGRSPKEWPGTVSHFIHRINFSPMCSPAFIEANRIDCPARLLEAPRLASDEHWWDLWFRAAGVAPAKPGGPATRLDTQTLEAQLVMAGQATTLLTPLLWTSELADGRLVQPFPTVAADETCVWLLYPEPKRNLPRIRAFRDWLLAQIELQAATDTTGAFVPPET